MSRGTATGEAQLYAVGQQLGVRFDPVTGRSDGWEIRVGDDIVTLPADETLTVWLLCHGRLDADGSVRRTQADVLAESAVSGIEEAPEILSALIELGAVARVLGDPASLADLARTHRVEPMMVGLGNAPEQPESFALGVPPADVHAVLSAEVMRVWLNTHLAPTLLQAVTDEAEVSDGDPDAVLAETIDAISELLAVGAIYLDRPAAFDAVETRPAQTGDTA